MNKSLPRRCIACRTAFSSSNSERKLCHSCEVALERMVGYAVPVVRCEECRFWVEGRHHTGRCKCLIDFHGAERYVTDAGHFCSYGERKTDD